MKDIDLAQKTFNELSEAIEQRGKERVFIEEFIKDQCGHLSKFVRMVFILDSSGIL